MKRKSFAFIIALICLSLVAAACGGSGGSATSGSPSDEASGGQTYEFRFTHNNQTSHIFHKTAEKFREELETRSGGRMTVKIFPAAQLGPEKDTVAQIQAGALDMGIITNAYLASNAEAFNAWFMPFVFHSVEEAAAARESEPAKKILETLGEQGMVGFDFIFAGNRHILMRTETVETPDDLKGKKIRITGSPSITDFWTAVGAGPTPMPLPEVFQALQTGVIDGIDIDLDALMTEKLYEVAKHFTVTNHMAFPGVFLMNKEKFESMPAEDQQIIRDAVKAAVDWGNRESAAMEIRNLEDLKATGVTVTELANRDAFTAVKDEIYNKYSSNPIIKEFLDTFAK